MVELTFRPGVSVAQVARENGVNANQLFGRHRAFERGSCVWAYVRLRRNRQIRGHLASSRIRLLSKRGRRPSLLAMRE